MASTTRRRFLKHLAGGTLAIGTSSCVTSGRAVVRRDARPNVLFILTDDQRGDTIHALGNRYIQTPTLDALARQGVVFENVYCMGGFSAAVCLPSRMMILRGRSWFSCRDLPKGFPTLPMSMQAGGYQTFHVGKRGNTDTEVQGQFGKSCYVQPQSATGNNDADQAVRLEGIPGKRLVDTAIELLGTRDRGRPFFMYLAGPEPHDPRIAPAEYLDRYRAKKLPMPANFLPFHPFDNGELLVRDERLAPWPRTEESIRQHLVEYYATITYMDEQFGRLFEALRRSGDYENTIIVFTSDQGIALGSHGLMGKQNLYEHSMRSPVIVAGPGIPRNKRVEALAYLFDVFPTICELAHVPVPGELEGRSLAPVLRGEREGVRDSVLLAYKDLQRAIRKGPWKLIRYPYVDKTQLFDLSRDPYETTDLSGDPGYSTIVSELMAAMREEQQRFGDPSPLTLPNPHPADVAIGFFSKTP